VRLTRRAIALAALALAGAIVLALLGAAVRGVAANTRGADERLAHVVADPEGDAHRRTLGTRVGEALLGVEGDRAFRDAVTLARAARSRRLSDAAAIARRGQAEAILDRIVRGDGDALLRSRAANLLGTLYFEDARVTRGNPRRLLELALGAFQDAVLLDPRDDVAKRNLELLVVLPLDTRFDDGLQGSESSATATPEGGY
jgi:hypothetical protein